MTNAINDRTNMASDIFNMLIQVTGPHPTLANAKAAGTTSQQYNLLRWLAQLSVNMVDYIDEDDYSTAFNWDPSNNGWVFGVELPRLLINEAYCQVDNDPADTGLAASVAAATKKSTTWNYMNTWVELYNPLPAENPSYPQPARCTHNANVVVNGNSIYEVVLVNNGLFASGATCPTRPTSRATPISTVRPARRRRRPRQRRQLMPAAPVLRQPPLWCYPRARPWGRREES